jgi:hypothetical protein
MSDARWFEIDASVASAVRHFAGACAIFPRLASVLGDDERYFAEMAFLHSMLAGQTALEVALTRILDLCGETPPSGPRWHADLVVRAASQVGARPPILSDPVRQAVDETRRFRSIAAHAYDSFDPVRATTAVESAARLVALLPEVIARFRLAFDP